MSKFRFCVKFHNENNIFEVLIYLRAKTVSDAFKKVDNICKDYLQADPSLNYYDNIILENVEVLEFSL